jgi:hypothetical protein
VSLEEELSEDRKKALEKARKIIDKEFQKQENESKSYAERSLRLWKISSDIHAMLKSRQDEAITKDDLMLLSSMVSVQSEIQTKLAFANLQGVRDLKGIALMLFYVPITMIAKVLTPIVEFIPKIRTEYKNALKAEFIKLEEQIAEIAEHKEEVRIDISEKFEKTFRWLEEKMKAEKRHLEEAKKMSI